MDATIKRQWEIFAKTLPCLPGSMLYIMTKRTFYQGAYAALSSLRIIAQIPDVSDEAGAALLEEINEELQRFMVDEITGETK